MIVITGDPRGYFDTIDHNKLKKVVNGDSNISNMVIAETDKREKVVFVNNPKKVIHAIRILSYMDKMFPKVFIIGGEKIYKYFIKNNTSNKIFVKKCIITHIQRHNCTLRNNFNNRFDTFFPVKELNDLFKIIHTVQIEDGVLKKVYVRK